MQQSGEIRQMPIVSVIQVGKSFGAERIFSGVSFQINEDNRIGLIGPNGAGKSTLLYILVGREEPDEGKVAVARNTRIGYLLQATNFQAENTLREEMLTVFAEVREWEYELHELGLAMAAPAAQADPALHEELLERYAELQARFEHAGGYIYENRVDQVLDGLGFTREQQESPVLQLSGGQQTRAALGKLLLQEPDLLLLDEPTNHLHLREERMERRQREYEAQQVHIAHTEEFIRRYKAGQRSREARGRQKLLNRLERVERPQDFPEMRFEFTPVVDSGLVVISTQKLAVGYISEAKERTELVRVADLELLRGDRVGLLGPNGSGKTTLLRTIIGGLPPVGGQLFLGHNVRIEYYSQTHTGLDDERSIIDEIRQVTTLSEEGARTFLGRFLFSGDDVFKPISALRGG